MILTAKLGEIKDIERNKGNKVEVVSKESKKKIYIYIFLLFLIGNNRNRIGEIGGYF